ncbi:MAG: hypothetical protein QOF83_348 [Solirubrobacteraceae bacterium]|jgi:hypothetical protein|nr:hypothetical protein [Solirubrobacteraceae bacterium]
MKLRVTPVGAVVLVLAVVGLALFLFASGTVAGVGLLLMVLAVAFVAADQLPAGLSGGWVLGKGRRRHDDQITPEPARFRGVTSPWLCEAPAALERYFLLSGAAAGGAGLSDPGSQGGVGSA